MSPNRSSSPPRHCAAQKVLFAAIGFAFAPQAVAEIPRLVRATPIRIHGTPSVEVSRTTQRALQGVTERNQEIRPYLAPAPPDPTFVTQVAGSENSPVTRTNQFVELHSEGARKNPYTQNTPSLTLATRPHASKGPVCRNPLVVDSPPKLRQFHVDDSQLKILVDENEQPLSGALIVRQPELPPRQIEDIDEVVDVLSESERATTDPRSLAEVGGFGMLAIDQIGSHLGKKPAAEHDSEEQIGRRYASDMVLPKYVDLPSRNQHGQAPTKSKKIEPVKIREVNGNAITERQVATIDAGLEEQAFDDIPHLPTPEKDSVADSINIALRSVSESKRQQDGAEILAHQSERPNPSFEELIAEASESFGIDDRRSLHESNWGDPALESTSRMDVPSAKPLEIEELIAASSQVGNHRKSIAKDQLPKESQRREAATQARSEKPEKPSIVQRLSSWTKAIGKEKQTEKVNRQKKTGGLIGDLLKRSGR